MRAQTQPKPAPKKPKGTVSGRVTIKDKPAQGVPVGLRKTDSGVSPLEQFYKSITDQNGLYRITNVPPGTYDILPSAPAFVVSDIGLNNQRAKNVIVGEDEDVEDINFSLVRGGVITGKISDADGRPVIQQQVHLYSVDAVTQQQQRQIYPSINSMTDDRGVYRFYGLAAGRYKVAVGRAEDGQTFNSSSRVIYKRTFYPDVFESDKATVIDVREGSEAADIDIKLGRPVQTFSASGRVINGENGQPVANVRFGLQRSSTGERFELVQNYAFSNGAGDFVVDGLVPGKYGVFLYPDPSQLLRAEPMSFEIMDGDVSALTIKLTKASTLSGVIVFESDDKKAWANLLQMKLRAYVSSNASAMIGVSALPASISPDGSFQIMGLAPGMINLWLAADSGFNAPKGFLISRVEHNGVTRPQGIELKEGEQISGVRVYVSYGTGTLRGTVNVDRGLMPEGARMFARLARVGNQAETVSNSMVDARGHFLMEGLPAGTFEVIVLLSAPSLRNRPPQARQQVTIQDGVPTDVEITLDLKPQPNP
ncbi:MAG TPA: carboxypeptidase-like regulatory domain-containing protein [Pyrinomonadaceae bacterium]|nr:carboxypeptidase-like regulatory domain-containing protein [Pyrinomonadaceae bacterium]